MAKVYETYSDVASYSAAPSNSSKPIIVPVGEGQKFDRNAKCYDMSGDKYLIILNQRTFKSTKHFGYRKPTTRYGTNNDVRHLSKVFRHLGFVVNVHRNWKYKNIIEQLKGFVALNHTNTSCIFVAILTHGETGNFVYAADKPYLLNDVIAIFDEEPSLINKPKIFIVQACRGRRGDAGYALYLDSPSDSILTEPAMATPSIQRNDAECHCCCFLLDLLFKLRRSSSMDGHAVFTAAPLLTVPTHADILVLYSSVEEYQSYRDRRGSWMIRALCNTIKEKYEQEHFVSMITTMNRMVAYENSTYNPSDEAMANKKQMPETRSTLTKEVWCGSKCISGF